MTWGDPTKWLLLCRPVIGSPPAVPAVTTAIQGKVLPVLQLGSETFALHRLILLTFHPHKYEKSPLSALSLTETVLGNLEPSEYFSKFLPSE